MPIGNPKPKKSFAEKLASYPTYDTREGYGNIHDWRAAWDHAMGHDEAVGILGAQSPLTILGFTCMPTESDLKKRYREMMLLNHPDKGGSEEQCKIIIAAYSELKRRLTKL